MEAYMYIDGEEYWVKLVAGEKITWVKLSEEQIDRLNVEGFAPKMAIDVDAN